MNDFNGVNEKICVFNDGVVVITNANSGRRVDIWDRSRLREIDNEDSISIKDRTPLYSFDLENDPISGLDVFVYDIDPKSIAMFVAISSTKGLLLKKLFISIQSISTIKAVYDHHFPSSGLLGVSLMASRGARGHQDIYIS